ncbi:MAG TPA: hypothetical protein VII68_14665 [Casimicrobiaceae bacterium]|jgi:hypothetical protein
MRTLVFQSYRAVDVPPALERAMASVREWARPRDHDYERIDDRFFDVLPAWYRQRVGDHKLVLANLARLLVAKRALDDGYDRAIWVDADVVVYAPDAFDVLPDRGFALARETWVERRGFDLVAEFKVNNAVCAFDRGNPFLDYAIFAHEALVRDRPERVYRFGTSTAMLTRLHMASPLPLLDDVAVLTPAMLHELAATGDGPALRELVRRHGTPMHAANLGWSLAGVPHNGIVATPAHYEAAVERLIATRGGPLAEARPHAPAASSAQSRGTR